MAVCWNSVRTAEEEDASRRRQLHSKRNTRRRLGIVGDAQLLLLRCRINYIMYKCTGAAGVCLVCVCAYSYIQINKITHQCHRGEWIIFPPVVKTMGAAAAAATAEK
jgi:hypothetical protein